MYTYEQLCTYYEVLSSCMCIHIWTCMYVFKVLVLCIQMKNDVCIWRLMYVCVCIYVHMYVNVYEVWCIYVCAYMNLMFIKVYELIFACSYMKYDVYEALFIYMYMKNYVYDYIEKNINICMYVCLKCDVWILCVYMYVCKYMKKDVFSWIYMKYYVYMYVYVYVFILYVF